MIDAYRRYWLEHAVPPAKLALFRVAFFTLLGIDAFLQLEHAPRYGAGDFNVAHLPLLDALLPLPSRDGMVVVFLLQAYLAFRIAVGGAVRAPLIALTALYGYGYFISQLNSFQHHYLIFLLLLVCCFVPWDGAAAERDGEARAPLRSWAIRLLLVQLAIVYLWAAIAKLDPAWLDGTALSRQIGDGWVRDTVERIFGAATATDPGGFGRLAQLVLLTELLLAVALLWRRLWPVALVVGVAFHAGVELAGFRIGLFSYFMFACYLLVVPDRWVTRAAAATDRAVGRRLAARWERAQAALRPPALAAAAVGALVAGALLVATQPYEAIGWVVAVTAGWGAVAVARSWRRGRGRAALRAIVAHLLACAAIFTLHGSTEQAFAYHRYWSGSAQRLGDADGARRAYRALTRVAPEHGPGHYHLGNFHRADGDLDAALASYDRAMALAPHDHRAFLAAALLHSAAGRGADALAAAEHVLSLSPKDQQAVRTARNIRERYGAEAR
jgi:tetratricopeptide (TPR) repeat protein